jgi:hypothetical protein
MNCPSCQAVNAENMKFCGECGASLGGEQVESSQQVMFSTQTSEQKEERKIRFQETNSGQKELKEPNEQVEKMKIHVSNYFSFFKKGILSPTRAAKSEPVASIHGITNLVLICVLMAGVVYQFMREVVLEVETIWIRHTLPSPLGLSFKLWIILLILFFVIGVTIFCFAKLTKSNRTFLEVFGTWGTFSTPVVALLIFAFLCGIIVPEFALILFLVAAVGLNISVTLVIKELRQSGLDAFYATLIANIVIGIVYYILIYSYVGSIFKNLLDIRI